MRFITGSVPWHRISTFCAFLGMALVCPAISAAAQGAGPLRLYSSADSAAIRVDPNGFPLNPYWRGAEASTPRMEDRCRFRATTGHLGVRTLVTTEDGCLASDERQIVSVNEATQALTLGTECVTSSLTGQIRGHVNWFPVTATGQLAWNSFSSGVFDHDINIDLLTPTPNAVTWDNEPSKHFGGRRPYHTEFYYDETLQGLSPQKGGFWSELVARHADKNEESPRGLVDDRFAIMTGLYNVDGVHGFHAELHPVFAMSVLISATNVGGHIREEWAVMVRNIGGQGDCASGLVPMLTADAGSPRQPFTVDLGSWSEGGTPTVSMAIDSTTGGEVLGAAFATDSDGVRHVYLTAAHPQPRIGRPGFLFLGTLRIDWATGDSATWSARLASLSPYDGAPRIKLEPLPLRDSSRFVALRLDQSVTRSPLRVYNASPWPMASPVGMVSCENSVVGVCHSGFRWAVGGTYWRSSLLPSLGHFRYPHSFYAPGEGFKATLLNYLLTVGWKYELRGESFRPTTTRGDTILRGPVQNGASFRYSLFVSPNDIRLKSLKLTPFTTGGAGASWVNVPGTSFEHELAWTTNWGIGALVQLPRITAFIDGQRLVRGGDYESHWAGSFGFLTNFPRLR